MRWGRNRDWVAFFYPGHKDKRGEREGKGKPTQRVYFLNFLVGPLSRLVSEDKCQCLDIGITLSGDN